MWWRIGRKGGRVSCSQSRATRETMKARDLAVSL